MRKVITGILAAVGLTIALTACGTPQLDDLKGVNPSYPDYAMTYVNVDNFPNITLVCVKGVGFATTTRDMNNIMRVPEWDAFCAAHETGR